MEKRGEATMTPEEEKEMEKKKNKEREIELLNFRLDLTLRELARAQGLKSPEQFAQKVMALIPSVLESEKTQENTSFL
ncbi:hypothetical protein A3J56_00240 [Candidatus Giovannonibacteria bacterium RIFCSPHIGHO2_02_FULL_46_20]|uniref:Uncharacterized protein n=1 Tax=Candidatus Giovannonibacteria bacterium RIFCSPHIGHO2_02_FULL_46_20 TaxID=1798338 RepID=A0A1F5WF07_9BACT|nr:MAG: hypothetical protein A3J56_00240 [Candidatus Giovannonibacteria bacterium RIFCSPHIGHO2_02_FULL_46_20]